MGYQTHLASDLLLSGLQVEFVPGWETRGNSSFSPAGVVCHWTAGPRDSIGRPSLNVVVNGRAGLPGPLCNVYLDRFGICVIVAAGRANHAGLGGYRGLTGNTLVYGVEAECGGDGDWTDAQRAVYPRLVAAMLRGIRRDASWAIGHNEWAPTRKIDIRDWDMPAMREQVAAVLAGGTVVPVDNPIVVTPVVGHATLRKGSRGAEVKVLQRFLGLSDDGVFGSDTDAATRAYQRGVGLVDDGIVGHDTWAKIDSGARPAPAPAPPAPLLTAPDFPLPAGSYFGPKSGPAESVSGYFSHREDLRTWQQRMKDRGWNINPDGLYGNQTGDIAEAFQREKHLLVDRKIGPQTWAAAWTYPVT